MRSLKYRPIVSIALVAINCIVFVICKLTGDFLYNVGVLDPVEVFVRHEYGRILWSMFLHSGIRHLFNNMLILYFLGSMIEMEVGHTMYGVLYFLSGIGGNLFSLWSRFLHSDPTGSLGASGAVFGLDGVLLAMVLLSDKRMANVTPGRVIFMIVYSLYSGFVSPNIDNVAHVGGLLTGFVAAGILCFFSRGTQGKRR